MKVLLINPPAKNTAELELPAFVRRNEGRFPPLGLMYLASYLEKHNTAEVKILDTVASGADYGAIESGIREFDPDVAGITAHTHNLIDVIRTSDIVKKVNPAIHVSLGGPHVRIYPYEAIAIESVDTVIPGEGEIALSLLLEALERNRPEDAKGVIRKKKGQILPAEDGEITADLDSLPFPARSKVNTDDYSSILGKGRRLTTAVSSRGCPFNCTFCSTPKGTYRMRSPKNIVDEMEECLRMEIEEVHFIDDVFNADRERVTDICGEILERGLEIEWSFRGRVDKVTPGMLLLLRRAGCERIHFGVETASDEGLEALGKGITLSQVRNAFRWARQADIRTVAYFMLGCPHEKSKKDTLKTVRFAKELGCDYALFNILTPYPGTPLYEEALKTGDIKTDYWREFARNPKQGFRPPAYAVNLDIEMLTSLLKEAYRSFYLRPGCILRNVKKASGAGLLKRGFRAGIDILTGS